MPEDSVNKMMAAASTLGWNVDEWPETFNTDLYTWTKDKTMRTDDGDVVCVEYLSDVGEGLVVFND